MDENLKYFLLRVSVLLLMTVQSSASECPPSQVNFSLFYITAYGNSAGAPCVFPFFYDGVYYNACIRVDRPNPWCSTTNNYTRDGKWGECLDYDVCLSHKSLSDPWRNAGFNSTSLPGWPMNDLNLKEGWYSFIGIGGDRLVPYCSSIFLSDTSNDLQVNDFGGFILYTCDVVVDGVQSLDCGGGLMLYYLVPTNETYTTRHSSCTASSCGKNASCNSSNAFGSCTCDSGLSSPSGFLTTGDSFTCTDFRPKLSQECRVKCSADCAGNLFKDILASPTQVAQKDVVTNTLLEEMNCLVDLVKTTTDDGDLASHGDLALKATEKLMTGLVMVTLTYYSTSIFFEALAAEVFVVGPNASLVEIPRLNTSSAFLDIDLIGIAKNNNGSAAVVFISYNNFSNILKPSLFNKHDGTEKVMVSTVVSVLLINITKLQLTKPMKLTLIHTTKSNTTLDSPSILGGQDTNEVDSGGSLFCVTWKETEWVNEGCSIIWTNSSQTVCSCDQPGTFALIMQINCSTVGKKYLYLFNLVAMAVGLCFLALTLLIFALCHRHLKVNSTAKINLCISLLLAHLLFLLTQNFLHAIRAHQSVCRVMAGVLHFLFLSAFVWMFIDAVLLFICAKNLTKIRSQQKKVLGWKCLVVIGYVIPLVMVGVSAGLVPDGFGSKQCWLKTDKNFFWSFTGPVCVILGLNLILFVSIFIKITFTIKSLNSEIVQRKNTLADKQVIQSVMLKTMSHFFILGCPWVLGFFTCQRDVVEILFLFFNSQQGTFIFFIHCVLNKEIRDQLKKRFGNFFSKSTGGKNVQK